MASSRWAMEGLVIVIGMARIALVGAVAFLNVGAILRPRSVCLHSLISEAVLLCNVIYLGSWLPFLLYSFLNGHWVILDDHSYCHMQNFVTNTVSMVFLGLLSVLVVDQTRMKLWRTSQSLSPRHAAAMVLSVWVLPQLLYDLAAILGGQAKCRTLLFRFLDDIVPFSEEDASGQKYRIGFMICEQVLTKEALVEHIWKYVLVVVPFCLLVCTSALLLLCCRCFRTTDLSVSAGDVIWHKRASDQLKSVGCIYEKNRIHCTDSVEIILLINLLWQLIFRPFLIYIIWGHPHQDPKQLFGYMDLGSHLVLTISTVFVPLASTADAAQNNEDKEVTVSLINESDSHT